MVDVKQGTGSLTDAEIALVKNLLATDEYSNQEILGFINAVRRLDGVPDTNGGRISEVRSFQKGKLDKLTHPQIDRIKPIPKASDVDRDAYLIKAKNSQASPVLANASPLGDKVLKELLPIKAGSPLALNITETDRIECKETFNYVMKTIAAFANNKGGYFIFGVKDKTWEVVGLSDKKLAIFSEYDLKIINTDIRNKLGADLQIQKCLLDIKEKKVGVLYIAPAHIKPLIFVSGDGDITQGHIYYRYSGEDRLISPQDLQKLIEDRLRQLSETVLLKQLLAIFKNGIENSAVMNVSSGEVVGKSGSFVIDESLLQKINFIKEGEFNEKDGGATLKLVGEVKSSAIIHKLEQVHISESDLLETFLKQEKPVNPEAFIKRYAESAKNWLPIYYFAAVKGFSLQQLGDFLEKNTNISEHKLKKTQSGKKPANPYNAKSFIADIAVLKTHKIIIFSKFEQCKQCLRALQCWDFSKEDQAYVLSLLNSIYNSFYKNCSKDEQGLIRATIAYLDVKMFKPNLL